jgi:hypothetical protein
VCVKKETIVCRNKTDCKPDQDCIGGKCVDITPDAGLDVGPDTGDSEIVKKGKITAEPLSVEFGAMRFGEKRERIIKVRNSGNADLKILKIELDANADPSVFSFKTDFVFGSTLKPDSEFEILAYCQQNDEAPDSGDLLISSDDIDMPILRIKMKNSYKDQPELSVKYLNDKRNLGLSTKELIEIGKEIGSDVPFFLLNENAAIATGRGEILEPIRSTFNYPIILGFPGCRILTKWAYEKFDELSSFTKFSEAYKKAVKIADALENNDISLLETEISNDFEKIVNTRCPEILDIKDILISLGAQVATLSGSGSAVFGIFERMPFLENFGEKLLPSSFLEMD